MSKIVLISCVSKKKNIRCKAEELYISPLFIKSLKYAKQLNPDNIYILSAKYGLVRNDEFLEPYNLTLNNFSKDERIEWSNKVIEKLKSVTSIDSDNFIILAGNNYYEYLINKLKHYELPLDGLGIGKRLKWLDEHINKYGLLF